MNEGSGEGYSSRFSTRWSVRYDDDEVYLSYPDMKGAKEISEKSTVLNTIFPISNDWDKTNQSEAFVVFDISQLHLFTEISCATMINGGAYK